MSSSLPIKPIAANAGSATRVWLMVKAPEPSLVHVLQDVLEESGYAVSLHGFTLKDLAEASVPDAVLLELREADDIASLCEFAAQLKMQPGWGEVPLFLLGTYSEPVQTEMALAAGVTLCLDRPVRPRDLLNCLASLVSKRPSKPLSGVPALGMLDHDSMVVQEQTGRCIWHTTRVRGLMADYFSGGHFERGFLPPELTLWMHRETLRRSAGGESKGLTVLPQAQAGARALRSSSTGAGGKRLSFDLHAVDPDFVGEGHCLIVMREADDWAMRQGLARALTLNAAEAQWLVWLLLGKSQQNMAALQGCSASEWHQLLQGLQQKLGVTSLDAALTLARSQLQALGMPLV
ncbi:response regulator [Roseateles koreensis]|uniref:Response regulatory domain-containing protein n=1 Tax=Roseateles koreensis TaxID=2987526 RepID=A0ABT5KMF8_9BURK|nr:hypothetical protein [Roseateles koreensis]MDC8784059.1 hypothetical protein [Roseateles koreensis]